jgi:hypothetical protein
MRLDMRGLHCARNEGHPYREATEEFTCRGEKALCELHVAKKGQKDAETKLDKLGSMKRSFDVVTASSFARSSSP